MRFHYSSPNHIRWCHFLSSREFHIPSIPYFHHVLILGHRMWMSVPHGCVCVCVCVENGAIGTWAAGTGETGTSRGQSFGHGRRFVDPGRSRNIRCRLLSWSGRPSSAQWIVTWISTASQLLFEVFDNGGGLQSQRASTITHAGHQQRRTRRLATRGPSVRPVFSFLVAVYRKRTKDSTFATCFLFDCYLNQIAHAERRPTVK